MFALPRRIVSVDMGMANFPQFNHLLRLKLPDMLNINHRRLIQRFNT